MRSKPPPLKLAKQTILIGSGKGGVGKSTLTVNLGVAFAQLGLRVGLLDADLYGPSIPIMTGLRRLSPEVIIDTEGKERIMPFTKYGMKILSVGFFIEEARSTLFRGPLLHGTLQKMIYATLWGDLDLLLIDLPPGTGDVPMSLSELLHVDGALIVTTPQEVAVMDAVKAINALDILGVQIIGVIENMAGFTVPETGKTYHIFGEGWAKELAHRFSVPLVGSVPLLEAIRQGGDQGCPSAFHNGDSGAGAHFREIAKKLII